MSQNMSEDERKALEVVGLRKELHDATAETTRLRNALTEAEKYETEARNALKVARDRFVQAMGG